MADARSARGFGVPGSGPRTTQGVALEFIVRVLWGGQGQFAFTHGHALRRAELVIVRSVMIGVQFCGAPIGFRLNIGFQMHLEIHKLLCHTEKRLTLLRPPTTYPATISHHHAAP